MREEIRYGKIFFTGLLISFLGALPLGTLNVLAARMAVDDGVGPAIWFSLGALIVEMIYVRLSLVAMDWIRRQKKWLLVLEGLTILVLLLLAIGSFWAAGHPYRRNSVGIGFISPAPIPRLFIGMVLSAINPLQIPFWFGWSTALLSRKILLPHSDHYNAYIAGIGLGTFAGLGLFIFGGRLLVDVLNMHEALFNGMIGVLFVITAGWQLLKIFKRAPGGPFKD
jgi:threonine/homoserine/homoserine lactone efflux protein